MTTHDAHYSRSGETFWSETLTSSKSSTVSSRGRHRWSTSSNGLSYTQIYLLRLAQVDRALRAYELSAIEARLEPRVDVMYYDRTLDLGDSPVKASLGRKIRLIINRRGLARLSETSTAELLINSLASVYVATEYKRSLSEFQRTTLATVAARPKRFAIGDDHWGLIRSRIQRVYDQLCLQPRSDDV